MNLLRILLLILVMPYTGNCQKFVWAKQFLSGTVGSVIDTRGNVYVAGTFFDSVRFGNIIIKSNSQQGSTGNIYITKYDPSGLPLSVIIQNGGGGNTTMLDMCMDEGDNIYILAQYQGDIALGGYNIKADIGVFSYYLAKCDTAGNFLWVKAVNNPFNIYSGPQIRLAQIAADKNGDVAIFGLSDGSYNLDGISVSKDKGRVFVGKLNGSDGTAQWVQHIGGNAQYFDLIDLVTDNNNNIVACGVYGHRNIQIPGLTCIFNGTDTLATSNFNSSNVFLGKYSSNGSYQWATQIGGLKQNNVVGIAADEHNNVFVIGDKVDTSATLFGSQFLSKIDANGKLQWLNRFRSGAAVNAISSNGQSVFVHIYFEDSTEYNNYTIRANGLRNAVLKVDTLSGAVTWNSVFEYSYWGGKLYASDKGSISMTSGGFYKTQLGADMLYNWGELFGYVSLISDSNIANLPINKITGNIFSDTNKDCTYTTDPVLADFAVVAYPGPYYGIADGNGSYTINVPPGTYTVKQVLPENKGMVYAPTCQVAPYTVSATGINQILPGFDFPGDYNKCYLLHLSINGGDIYKCNELKKTELIIRNYGTDTVFSPVVRIKYPGGVIQPFSSVPAWSAYTHSDSIMTFMLGDIAPNAEIKIIINDMVTCNSIYDLAYIPYKYSAKITPDNYCYPEDSVHTIAADTVEIKYVMSVNTIKTDVFCTVYPNPTTGIFRIKTKEKFEDCKLYNTLGQTVDFKYVVTTEGATVDISHAQAGIYILNIGIGNNVQRLKIYKY